MESAKKNMLLGNDQNVRGLTDKLNKLTDNEGRLTGAETLVLAKKSGRSVEAMQITLTENTMQLGQLALSQTEVSQRVSHILDAIEHQKVRAREEKDEQLLEPVMKAPKPSVATQDRFHEIKREHVHGSGDWVLGHSAFEGMDRLASVATNLTDRTV